MATRSRSCTSSAAALRSRGKEITLLLSEEYPLHRLLPRDLGLPLLEFLRDMGVETVSGDVLVKVEGNHHVCVLNGIEVLNFTDPTPKSSDILRA